MPHLIKNRRVVPDSWLRLEGEQWLLAGDNARLPGFPAEADLIVPLAVWRARRAELLERKGNVGVEVNAEELPESIAEDLDRLDLIAVRIPKFADGRAYSLGALLRERYGFQGELRVVGDVLRDHLYYLARCGFDAFELRPDQDPQEALSAFDDFSEDYQTSVGRPPLFQRRSAGAHS